MLVVMPPAPTAATSAKSSSCPKSWTAAPAAPAQSQTREFLPGNLASEATSVASKKFLFISQPPSSFLIMRYSLNEWWSLIGEEVHMHISILQCFIPMYKYT